MMHEFIVPMPMDCEKTFLPVPVCSMPWQLKKMSIVQSLLIFTNNALVTTYRC